MPNNDNKKVKDTYNKIKEITTKSLNKNTKKESENSVKGALLGAGAGIILGLATRKNIWISGLFGLIIGKLIITKR